MPHHPIYTDDLVPKTTISILYYDTPNTEAAVLELNMEALVLPIESLSKHPVVLELVWDTEKALPRVPPSLQDIVA